MPRPIPFAITGIPAASTNLRASTTASSVQTSDPSTSTGWRDSPSRRAISSRSDGSGSRPGATGREPVVSGTTHVAGAVDSLNNTSIGMSRKTGPRCAVAANRKASSIPLPIASAAKIVEADLVTDATNGG